MWVIVDPQDVSKLIEVAKEVAAHREVFYNTFRDCPNTLSVLRQGARILETLHGIEKAKSSSAQANLKKAITAAKEGNWTGVGEFFRKEAHSIASELQ